MSSQKPLLSIVVPVYNEEGKIEALHSRLTAALPHLPYEIIYVNDGSQDRSLALLVQLSQSDSRVKYIDFSRNFGHQMALSAGAQASRGEYTVFIDGDGQDPPELIPELLAKAQEGYEVVYAQRKSRAGETWLKRYTAKQFYRLLSRITQVPIPVDTGDFRIIHQKVRDVLNSMPEQHKYLRGQIAWIGFQQTALEYDRQERMSGHTKFSYRRMLRFALDGISGFSTWPLKVATLSGFLVSGIAFMLILYSLYQKFFGSTEPGWTSLHISVLFLGGIQLLGIGILGEYLGRVSDNVKNRPGYIVRDSNVSDEE
ncbi:MAG: glycosyltransferase family 2 protein [Bacteroidia bacterium]